MKSIEILQKGNVCEVYHDRVLVCTGGRVDCKQFARELHEATGDPVFNWKSNNTKVEVYYKTPTK